MDKSTPAPGNTPDNRQTKFWDRAAQDSGFHHPLNLPLLNRLVGREQPVVELGCGWGRVLRKLAADGYSRLTGFDPSPKMIARGRLEFPALGLHVWPPGPVPLDNCSAGAVLLFAVLTCVPSDSGQRELIGEALRLLRPGGVLYVSDYLIQSDERNRRRYSQWETVHGKYGVFEIDSGAVLRHLERNWFRELTDGLAQVAFEEIEVYTMNGNSALAFQYFGRKPA